jgi:hypothetical protein
VRKSLSHREKRRREERKPERRVRNALSIRRRVPKSDARKEVKGKCRIARHDGGFPPDAAPRLSTGRDSAPVRCQTRPRTRWRSKSHRVTGRAISDVYRTCASKSSLSTASSPQCPEVRNGGVVVAPRRIGRYRPRRPIDGCVLSSPLMLSNSFRRIANPKTWQTAPAGLTTSREAPFRVWTSEWAGQNRRYYVASGP